MVVLLKEKADNALALIEAIQVRYDPKLEEFYIYDSDGDGFFIKGISKYAADDFMRKIYSDGKIDLTCYLAEVIQDEGDTEEDNENDESF